MREKLAKILDDILGEASYFAVGHAGPLWMPGEDVPHLVNVVNWVTRDGRHFSIMHYGGYVQVTGPRGFVYDFWWHEEWEIVA